MAIKRSQPVIFNKPLIFLRKQSKFNIIFISLGNIIVIGFLDFITGVELSFSLFYLLPISIVTWFLGKKLGILFSFFSVIIWQIVNIISGQNINNYLIASWNFLTYLIIFLMIAFLLDEINNLLYKVQNVGILDVLTGVSTRKRFHRSLNHELFKLKQSKDPFSLVYIDLDHFKKLNDKLGHFKGDLVLKTISKTIQKNIRDIDIIGRLGGNEFAIILRETDEKLAKEIVPKLQQSLLKSMEKNKWLITFSIGVMTYINTPTSTNEAINLAKELMYDVKSSGRNNIKYSLY